MLDESNPNIQESNKSNLTSQNTENPEEPASMDGIYLIYGVIGGIIALLAVLIPWVSYGYQSQQSPSAPVLYHPYESLYPLNYLNEAPFMMMLSLAGLLFLAILRTLWSSIIAFSCGLIYLVLSIYSFFEIKAIADFLVLHSANYSNHVSIEFGFFISLIGTLLLIYSGIKGINNILNQLSKK